MTLKIFYFLLTLALCVFIGVLFFASYRNSVRKKGNAIYFQMNCISIFIWLVFSLVLFTDMDIQMAHEIAMWRYVGIAFMPIAMAMHIWQQLSSVPPKKIWQILLFMPPTFSSILAVTNKYTGFFIKSYTILDPQHGYSAVFHYNWGFYLHCLFSYAAVLCGIIMLLRIFFQVPKRMRKTINLMACAMLVTILCNAVVLMCGKYFSYDITIIGAVVTSFLFYLALRVTRSANIIITSREYVWENLSSMNMVLDADGLVLDYNKANMANKTGLAKPDFMEPYEGFRKRWIASRQGRVSKYDDNIVTFAMESGEVHYRIKNYPIIENGVQLGSLVEIVEITEVYTLLRYMEESSRYDYLTGLYNRNAYIQMAPQMHRAECFPLLVMIGDVNRLKRVNDERGHVAGDKLLQSISTVLRQAVPPQTFVGRIGGDEFVILMANASAEKGEEIMQTIQEQCRQIDDTAFGTPSISLGYSVVENAEKPLCDAVEEADRNMYTNKRQSVTGARRRHSII